MPAATSTASAATPARTKAIHGPVIVAVGGRDPIGVLRAARGLASTGREVLALAVLEPYSQFVSGVEPILLPPAFDTERATLRMSSLRDQLRALGDVATSWQAQVVHGAPGPALAESAQAMNASLIVMGIGRHRPLDRLLGGETTLQTIRHAPCPVLAVMADGGPPFHHAVAATDFGPSSAWAAESAMSLLDPSALLTLMHAWQPGALEDDRLAEVDRAYREALPERFRRLREAIGVPPGVTVKEVVREGNPAECVLDYATAHQADLVVAGRRNLRALARLAVGSVTTALVRGAACSVLVSPRPPFGETDRFHRLVTGKSETHEPAQWVQQLGEFTARNRGRRVSVEVDDVMQGAQVIETGYRLLNVTYEPRLRRLELEVGSTDGGDRRVTRRIVGVEELVVVTDAHGTDTALQVLHGPGQTVLSFTADRDSQ